MKIPEIINRAKNMNAVELGDLLRAEVGDKIFKALTKAKKDGEYLSIVVLTDLTKEFPCPVAKTLKLTEEERKQAVSIKIECNKTVPVEIINCIFDNAGTDGDITMQTTHNLCVLMLTDKAISFIENIKKVEGCKVTCDGLDSRPKKLKKKIVNEA